MMHNTVSQFAIDFQIPVESLLNQLERAGCSYKTAESILTADEKSQLLSYLRSDSSTKGKSLDNKRSRLQEAGYISSALAKALRLRPNITDPESIVTLARRAVHAAYSNYDVKTAQVLIELLPKNLQKSLADWFTKVGLPCMRISQPLHNLPNSLWIVAKPNRKQQAKTFQQVITTPLRLVSTDPKHSQTTGKPFFDDREIEERGHSVRAWQGGATGLKK